MTLRKPYPHRFFPPFLVLLTLAVGVLTGCGGGKSEKLTLVPVSGKVTVGKTVLPTGSVLFYPDASKGNDSKRIPSGLIQPNGSYTLQTSDETGVHDGAPVGWYKVTVTPTGMSGEAPAKGKVPSYNPDYNHEKNTRLSVEVKEGGGGNYDLVLSP